MVHLVAKAFIKELPIPDKIPIKIIKDVPLPIPYSVILSPNHITNVEPAVKIITVIILDSHAENSITDGSFFGIIAAINGTFGSQGTIFSLGIMPFINSFIIMQLVTIIVPKLERMSKEGEEGRKKITQITRYVAIALAVVQAFGFVMSWGDNFIGLFGTGVANKWLSRIMTVIILTAG